MTVPSEEKLINTLSAIPVFCDARMVADARNYSPSAGKPREVVESWKAMIHEHTPRECLRVYDPDRSCGWRASSI